MNHWGLPEWALTSFLLAWLAVLWSSWWARDRRPLVHRRPPTAPLPPTIPATYTRPHRPIPKELSE